VGVVKGEDGAKNTGVSTPWEVGLLAIDHIKVFEGFESLLDPQTT
jgi:hypothetical protein